MILRLSSIEIYDTERKQDITYYFVERQVVSKFLWFKPKTVWKTCGCNYNWFKKNRGFKICNSEAPHILGNGEYSYSLAYFENKPDAESLLKYIVQYNENNGNMSVGKNKQVYYTVDTSIVNNVENLTKLINGFDELTKKDLISKLQNPNN